MNKVIKKIFLIGIFILFIFLGDKKVFAASASISASSTKVEPGTNVTITASVSDVEVWNLSLSTDGGSLSGTTSSTDAGDGNISKQVISATFSAENEGTYTITLKGEIADTEMVNNKEKKTVSETVKITVAKKEEPPETNTDTNTNNNNDNNNSNNDNNNNNPTNTTKLSSDATLKNLGIKPNDFKGFNAKKENYNVTVPNDVEKINIYATKNQSGQTITGTGDKTLKVGDNKFEVTVTAEDKKTTKTYTLNITRESISKVATLKNLGIRPNDFKNFKSGTLSYTVDVPYDTEEIEIYAEASSSKAKIEGTGKNKKLDVGKNTFAVKVTAEDGETSSTYTLVINRKAQTEEIPKEETPTEEQPQEDTPTVTSDVKGLTKLTVTGITLNPAFKNDIYEYTIETTDEEKSLNLKTETSGNKYTVEVVGNENLKVGENLITILVHNAEDDKDTTTYQIIVNVKQADVDVSMINEIMNTAQINQGKHKKIIISVVGVVIILVIIFFVVKYKINKDGYYVENEPEEEINNDSEDEEFMNKHFRKANIHSDMNEQKIEENVEGEETAKKVHSKGKRYK